MAEQVRKRSPSEVLRRGYSDEEILEIYEMALIWLEVGDLRRAEAVLTGLTEIAPDIAHPWLALAYVYVTAGRHEEAIACSRQTLRLDPDSIPAMLYLITLHITTNDMNSAGTYLGEVQERVESGLVHNQYHVRYFTLQLARYQSHSQ